MCVHVEARGREREKGRSQRVSVCAPVRYDLFRLFSLMYLSPIILRKTTCYSVMFYSYVFTN